MISIKKFTPTKQELSKFSLDSSIDSVKKNYQRNLLEKESIISERGEATKYDQTVNFHARAIVQLPIEMVNPLFIEGGEADTLLIHKILGIDKDSLKQVAEGSLICKASDIDKLYPSTIDNEHYLIGAEIYRAYLDRIKKLGFKNRAAELFKEKVIEDMYAGNKENFKASNLDIIWDEKEYAIRAIPSPGAENYSEKTLLDINCMYDDYIRNSPRNAITSLIRANENTYECLFIKYLPTIPQSYQTEIAGRIAPITKLYDDLSRSCEALKVEANIKKSLHSYINAHKTLYYRLRAVMVIDHSVNDKAKKSVKDIINGKEGIPRSEVLSCTMNSSARSVVTAGGIDLPVDKIRVPKPMIKTACEVLLKQGVPLEDIRVFFNRQPSLHKPSGLSFGIEPTDQDSLQTNALVSTGFNLDHDGDTGSLNIPHSVLSNHELRVLTDPLNNLFKPATGEVLVSPHQEIILGMYIITDYEDEIFQPRNISVPSISEKELKDAYINQDIYLPDTIKVDGKSDTVRNHLMRYILKNDKLYNKWKNIQMNKSSLNDLFLDVFKLYDRETIRSILSNITDLAYWTTTLYPLPLDLNLDLNYSDLIDEFHEKAEALFKDYEDGLMSEQQYKELYVDYASDIKKKADLSKIKGGFQYMAKSGAKGSNLNLLQIFVNKGLMSSDSDTIFIPSNFLNGLTSIEHIQTAIVGRQTLITKARQPADTGYLTRQCVFTAADIVIKSEDCGTTEGITYDRHEVKRFFESRGILSSEDEVSKVYNFIIGRYTTDGQLITDELAKKLANEIVIKNAKVTIRSPLTCKDPCCIKCYGVDWSTRKLPVVGTSVGTIAGQSVGELGTQLSMKVFHFGGVAGSNSISSDFGDVKNILNKKSVSTLAGNPEDRVGVDEVATDTGVLLHLNSSGMKHTYTVLPYIYTNGITPETEINSDIAKMLLNSIDDDTIKKVVAKNIFVSGIAPKFTKTHVRAGEGICKIQGKLNIDDILNRAGLLKAQRYIASSITTIYSTSSELKPIHSEILALGMTRYVGTGKNTGSIIEAFRKDLLDETYFPKIYSTKECPRRTNNWFSALAFDRVTGNIRQALLYNLTDDGKNTFSRILLGLPPKCGSHFYKDRTKFVNLVEAKYKEEFLIDEFSY